MVRMGRAPRGWSKSSSDSNANDASHPGRPKRSSPTMRVGTVSTNVIASIYAPLLTDVALKISENYAEDVLRVRMELAEWEEEERERERRIEEATAGEEDDSGDDETGDDDDGGEDAKGEESGEYEEVVVDAASGEISDVVEDDEQPIGGGGRPRPNVTPPQRPLFVTQSDLDEFATLLRETSRSVSGNGPWRARVNAAKFERQLDERYGFFRPIATHPEVERYIRFFQRRYALGHISLTRQGDPPLAKHTSVILLFMMHRNKVRGDVLILAALFLLVGLQPWALVALVAMGSRWMERRRVKMPKYMRSSGMDPESIEVRPYYEPKGQEEGATDRAGTAMTDEEELKRQCLLQPVGDPFASSPLSAQNAAAAASNHPNSYDVLIVGSGPDALYCAALLSRTGRRTLVLSPLEDASGCLTLNQPESKQSSPTPNPFESSPPFDVADSKVGRIEVQQRLLAPALCNEIDCQGGVRFARVGTEADGFAYDILTVPGMGRTGGGGSMDEEGVLIQEADEDVPFVLRAGGMAPIADDASLYLGDGWYDPDLAQSSTDGKASSSTGTSAIASYLQMCEALNVDSSTYYTKKTLPPKGTALASLLGLQSKSAYGEAAVRYSGDFLKRLLPLNPHVRSLAAAVGLRGEDLPPRKASMAAHISNASAACDPQGFHYPVGGPRSLCHALRATIEASGGAVLTGVSVKEFLFQRRDGDGDGEDADEGGDGKKKGGDEEEKHHRGGRRGKHSRKRSGGNGEPEAAAAAKKADEETVVGPRCIGVKLEGGEEVLLGAAGREGGDAGGKKKKKRADANDDGAVVSFLGMIPTFMLMPEEVRNGGGVPRGMSVLAERRPHIKILLGLRGDADDLNLPAADWWRLPSCSLPRDGVDALTGAVKPGDVGEGSCGDEPEDEETEEEPASPSSSAEANVAEEVARAEASKGGGGFEVDQQQHGGKKKRGHGKKFDGGKSWMRVSFPSAKDPSWRDRHPRVSTCVVTIEADDDFVRVLDGKPRVCVFRKAGPGEANRLMERVMRDVYTNFPQLEGNVACHEMRGPFRAGLSQTPEKFAIKGVRPKTNYPGLFVGGSDLTVDSFAGSIVGAWLAANAVVGYGVIDTVLLEKNVTTDLNRFILPPPSGSSDVAVPFDEGKTSASSLSQKESAERDEGEDSLPEDYAAETSQEK